jgi:hypothetical protein
MVHRGGATGKGDARLALAIARDLAELPGMSGHEALATDCHLANVGGYEVVVIDPENLWRAEWGAFTAQARSLTAEVQRQQAGPPPPKYR